MVSIENTDGERFGHYRVNVGFSYPPKPGDFRILGQSTANWTASEYQGYDAPAHVFIDAGKSYRLNEETSFLFDLAQQTVCYRFIALKDAARRFPMCVVAPLDNECASVLIDHDTSNAHRVARVLAGHPVTPIKPTDTLETTRRLDE